VARGQHGIFKEAGYRAHDVTWAIVTFADGAILTYDAALLASGGEPGRLKVTRGGPPGHVRPALAE